MSTETTRVHRYAIYNEHGRKVAEQIGGLDAGAVLEAYCNRWDVNIDLYSIVHLGIADMTRVRHARKS
jgi:hypothetical protein